jgi:hypothetical protein
VVNLNDTLVKPVRRENSNTTEVTRVTGITGITTSTGITNGFNGSSGKNKTFNTFYSTDYQIKGSKNYNQATNGTVGR